MHDQCLKISTISMLNLWDTVKPVLYAAEKYNMPGLALIMHTCSLMSPCGSTLQHATLAGWRTRAQHPPTCSQSTSDLKNHPTLFKLHHEWHKQFHQHIAESPFLTNVQLTDIAHCSHCYDSIPYIEWCELQNVVFAKLETCPSRDTVLAGLKVWPAAQVYWVQQVLPTHFG
jgi:hypothetical protein